MSESAGPDTGFKLFGLVKDVLATSKETDTDQLALEVLERIPSYDRETALYQALRQLVRTSFRPAFIPQAPKDATTGGEVPGQRKAENPPPERDGRQWMPSFVSSDDMDAILQEGPIADDLKRRAAESDAGLVQGYTSEEVLASLKAGDEQIAAGDLGTPLAEVMAGLDAEDASDDLPDEAPGLMALAQQPRRYRQQPPLPPRPKTSPKVTAIREAWRKSLMQRIAVGEGKHKFLGDCTVDDLVYAAEQREQHAKRTADRAGELRRLVDLMREHDASKLSDLPAEVLAEAPLDGAA